MKKRKKILIGILTILIIFGAIIGISSLSNRKNDFVAINTLEQLSGKKIGVITGTVYDQYAKESIENPEIVYADQFTDVITMLQNGKIDAFLTDEPVVSYMQQEHPNLQIIANVSSNDYAMLFPKGTQSGDLLLEQYNTFLKKIKDDGTLDRIINDWFDNTFYKTIDFSKVQDGPNGKIIVAVSSGTGIPFVFIKDGEYAGFDIEIVVKFCEEYGYTLVIDDYTMAGCIAAVQGGKADIATAGYFVTEERKKNANFGDVYYVGGVSVITKAYELNSEGQTFQEFVNDQKNKFYQTFIVEDRYKLFLLGIGNTLLITLSTIILGTLLGFLAYFLGRNLGNTYNQVISTITGVISGMPLVVLLMILFYVVFTKASMSGTIVSIIGFTLVFGTSIYNMLKASVATVNPVQQEAALALGFNKTQSFFKVILPQSFRHFLPLFKSEVVAHLKATSIVGYVAVQDLTKVSDIIRSRTYEAFYPLIATAIVYFVIEFIFIAIVNSIEINTDPKKRSEKQILKGVK